LRQGRFLFRQAAPKFPKDNYRTRLDAERPRNINHVIILKKQSLSEETEHAAL